MTDVSVTTISYVITSILGGSASVVVPMVRTTLPKEDKVGTSAVEAPMA
jgi:hypothetical protein